MKKEDYNDENMNTDQDEFTNDGHNEVNDDIDKSDVNTEGGFLEENTEDITGLDDEESFMYTASDGMASIPKKKGGIWKWVLIPVVLLVAYGAPAVYFTQHVLPNTSINGRDISYKNITSVDPLEDAELKEIEIVKKDGTLTYLKPEDLNMKLSIAEPLKLEQNAFAWPLSFFERDDYQVKINNEYDAQKLNSFVDENFVKDSIKPEDAKISQIEGIYTIIPEVEGNTIDKNVVVEKLLEAINSDETKVDLTEYYKTPSVRSTDEKLVNAIKEIDEFTNKELDIDFIFKKEKIDKKLLSGFVSIGDDYSVKFNEDKLNDYVVKLAVTYDTYDKPRSFESTNRGVIEVPPGIYGYQMDVAETMKLIKDSLKNGVKEIEPVYSIEGSLRTEDGGDIGSTYIEVDLSNQHLWYYENGELIVSTPVVTGDPTRGVATPPGANVIWHKERNKPLSGIDPGGAAYVAYVDYWMAVDWSHTGIHNARWRENAGGFGGNIFMGNGSYGCINTPYSDVETLYERAPYGTPVIMYN